MVQNQLLRWEFLGYKIKMSIVATGNFQHAIRDYRAHAHKRNINQITQTYGFKTNAEW